ncbi:MAG TPA: helix-turn-helix domain-containing protein [Trebonia sp.]|jgi:AcrR family transcriptional regulator
MSRWEPNARGRLAQAALELYSERGYDQVTVAEIATRAGLTERTFFRHYTDKREVLFYGASVLQDAFVAGIDEAPAGLAPIDVVGTALEAATAMFGADNAVAAQRMAVVSANPELRERELNKLAVLAGAGAEALRSRGVAEPAASLAAEAGIAVFKIAFQRWVDGPGGQPLSPVIRESLADLKSVAAGT